MLGWVTEERARQAGMTHHVRTYGVFPAYAAGLDSMEPLLGYKHPVFEWLDLYLVTPVVCTIQAHRGEEPRFMIQVIGELHDRNPQG